MRLVFCTFYKNLRREISACIFLKRKQPRGPSPCHSQSLSALYSFAPAKECEFIDLIFIGKTRASSCRVCKSVVWVCMCSPRPQTEVEKCTVGASRDVPTLPLCPQSWGMSRCGVLSQGSGAVHLACSSLPTPCSLGWADCRELRWAPAREGIRVWLPPASLKLMHFPRLKSSM